MEPVVDCPVLAISLSVSWFIAFRASLQRQKPFDGEPAVIGEKRTGQENPIEDVARIFAVVPVEQNSAHDSHTPSGDHIACPMLVLVEARDTDERRGAIARGRHVARCAWP